MKRLICLFSLVLFGLITLAAQKKTNPEVTKLIKHLTALCSLSPTQALDISPIVEVYLNALTTNIERFKSNNKGLNRANKTSVEQYYIELGQILNPKQLDKVKSENSEGYGSNVEGKAK